MTQDWSGSECFLEVRESGTRFFVKLESVVFVCQAGERNDDIGIVVNETSVEVSEA